MNKVTRCNKNKISKSPFLVGTVISYGSGYFMVMSSGSALNLHSGAIYRKPFALDNEPGSPQWKKVDCVTIQSPK